MHALCWHPANRMISQQLKIDIITDNVGRALISTREGKKISAGSMNSVAPAKAPCGGGGWWAGTIPCLKSITGWKTTALSIQPALASFLNKTLKVHVSLRESLSASSNVNFYVSEVFDSCPATVFSLCVYASFFFLNVLLSIFGFVNNVSEAKHSEHSSYQRFMGRLCWLASSESEELWDWNHRIMATLCRKSRVEIWTWSGETPAECQHCSIDIYNCRFHI